MKPLISAYIHLQALERSHEVYDFTLCQRPNGSFYGIADGRKCRKGTETEHGGDDQEISRDQLISYYQKILGDKGIKLKLSEGKLNLSNLDDEELAHVVLTASNLLTQRPGKRIDVMSLGEIGRAHV